MANLGYKERLALLDAGTLELHRLNFDLVTVYKILFSLLDMEFNANFAFKHDGATLCSSDHNCCLRENNGRVDARCNYFAHRTYHQVMDSLPAANIKCNSLASLNVL